MDWGIAPHASDLDAHAELREAELSKLLARACHLPSAALAECGDALNEALAYSRDAVDDDWVRFLAASLERFSETGSLNLEAESVLAAAHNHVAMQRPYLARSVENAIGNGKWVALYASGDH